MSWNFLFSRGIVLYDGFILIPLPTPNLLPCSCSFCCVGNNAAEISHLKPERNAELLRRI